MDIPCVPFCLALKAKARYVTFAPSSFCITGDCGDVTDLAFASSAKQNGTHGNSVTFINLAGECGEFTGPIVMEHGALDL